MVVFVMHKFYKKSNTRCSYFRNCALFEKPKSIAKSDKEISSPLNHVSKQLQHINANLLRNIPLNVIADVMSFLHHFQRAFVITYSIIPPLQTSSYD